MRCQPKAIKVFAGFGALAFLAIGVTASAQTYPVRSPQAQAAQQQQAMEISSGNSSINGPIVGTSPGEWGIPSGSMIVSSPAIPKLSKENKKRLEADNTDEQAYKSFLKAERTGIFKLINLPNCGDIEKPFSDQKCPFESYSVSHLANSFSFREGRHRRFGDLSLFGNTLVTSPHIAISFMTKLGDIPIESVSLDSPGVPFVAAFEPSGKPKLANEQVSQFDKGRWEGERVYARGFKKVAKDTTYVLRSHGYKVKSAAGRPDDVIVAFRVIRVDDSGDVTIVWKELQRRKGLKLDIE